MKKKIKNLKANLRYGDIAVVAQRVGCSYPTIKKAFAKTTGFSDIDIAIYKEAAKIIDDRIKEIEAL